MKFPKIIGLGHRRELAVFWFLCALFGTLILLRYRHHSAFFIDDWTIFGSRLGHLDRLGFDEFVLRRHNEHLMGGMVLWDVGLAKFFGLRNYLPWMITVQLANCFVSWVFFRYMIRVGLATLVAAIIAPFFMIWAPLGSVAYWAPEAVFTISLAFLMVHFRYLVLDTSSNKALILGTSAAMLGIFIHSICAVLIPISMTVFVIQRKWRSAFVASVPLVMYGLWFLTYQKLPQANPWPLPSSQEFPQVRTAELFFECTWKILSRAMWLNSSPLIACVFLVLVVIGFCMCFRRGGEQRFIATSAVIASTIFLAGFAWSRAYLMEILQQDPPGRYAAVVFLLLLPLAILPIAMLGQKIHPLLRISKKLMYFSAIAFVSLFTLLNFTLRQPEDDSYFSSAESYTTQIQSLADDPELDSLDPEEFVFGDNPWFDLTYGDIARFVRLGWL